MNEQQVLAALRVLDEIELLNNIMALWWVCAFVLVAIILWSMWKP